MKTVLRYTFLMRVLCLEIIRGAEVGRSFELTLGQCRILGRAFDASGQTVILSDGERRRLDVEDQRLVTEHLALRAAPGNAGARAAVESFVRESDIEIVDDGISQTHAMFLVDEAGVALIDIASTNGTFLNGRRITEAKLVDGDLIRVGETRLQVAIDSPSAKATRG